MSSGSDFGGGGDFGGGDFTGPVGPSAHRGWAFLQRSVNRAIPTSTARAQAVRRAALRRIAHSRRVHR